MAATRFATDVRAALDALDVEPTEVAFDAQLDADELERGLASLDKGGALLMRVAPELGEGTERHMPAPADPVWLRLVEGSRRVRGVNMCQRSRGAVSGGHLANVDRVIVDVEAVPCCASEDCAAHKHRASTWLHFEDGTRLLVIDQLGGARDAAGGACRRLAQRLADVLGVPLEGSSATEDRCGAPASRGDGEAALSMGLRAEQLARFALRTEGQHVVVRDYEHRRPQGAAWRELVAAALLAVPALGLWGAAARELTTDASMLFWGLVIVAFLLMAASYGFLVAAECVKRDSSASTPLVRIHADRIVIAPRTARDGAVSKDTERRLGAVMGIEDCRGVSLRSDGTRHAVVLESMHGAIELLSTSDASVGERLRTSLERRLGAAAHAGRHSIRAPVAHAEAARGGSSPSRPALEHAC